MAGIADFPITAAILCAALTGASTFVLRALLVAVSAVDIGTERGMHSGPVPRGGGVAFAAVSLITLTLARPHLPCSDGAAIALVLAALAVGSIGAIDDVRSLPAPPRLLVHLAAGTAVAYAYIVEGGEPSTRMIAIAVAATLVLGCAWFVNLNNFMDGIDGICAAHGALVIGAVGAFAFHHGDKGLAFTCAVLAGSIAGFLPLNMSRKFRIFMGDAGSGFIGFAMASMLMMAWKSGAMTPVAALLLPSVFVTDATVTLVRRAARGERLASAHCSHAFQHLAKRTGKHALIAVAYAVVTVGWAVSLAIVASAWPTGGGWVLVVGYGPLIAAATLLGAGMPDQVNPHLRDTPR